MSETQLSDAEVSAAGGMKETQELLKFFIGLGKSVQSALADGQLTLGDLKEAPHLYELAKEGIIGSAGIVTEFKNANGETLEESAQLLAQAGLELVQAVAMIKKYLEGK